MTGGASGSSAWIDVPIMATPLFSADPFASAAVFRGDGAIFRVAGKGAKALPVDSSPPSRLVASRG